MFSFCVCRWCRAGPARGTAGPVWCAGRSAHEHAGALPLVPHLGDLQPRGDGPEVVGVEATGDLDGPQDPLLGPADDPLARVLAQRDAADGVLRQRHDGGVQVRGHRLLDGHPDLPGDDAPDEGLVGVERARLDPLVVAADPVPRVGGGADAQQSPPHRAPRLADLGGERLRGDELVQVRDGVEVLRRVDQADRQRVRERELLLHEHLQPGGEVLLALDPAVAHVGLQAQGVAEGARGQRGVRQLQHPQEGDAGRDARRRRGGGPGHVSGCARHGGRARP